ncbi:MAG TPA: gephyrin-like molybdotransferase Glp [Longimicrobiales bacterium]|nr:gephyrin-like molybdotransferase Glp [Longimicrobiales bacterium]
MTRAGRRRDEADWIEVVDALERILGAVGPLDGEVAPLAVAAGRVLSEPVVAPFDLPAFDNSAMDGFAARAADVEAATRDDPAVLRLVADVPAGVTDPGRIGPGEAAKVMTGAPVPGGADSVIRVEHTDAWEGDGWERGAGAEVRIHSNADAGRNIRRRGEDVRAGSVALDAGTALGPPGIALLAALGVEAVRVHRRPRVAILSTGNEVVPAALAAEAAAGRAVVDANGPALAAAVEALGGVALPLGIARDDPAEIRSLASRGLDADALVTTAGASVGEHDIAHTALAELGLRPDFWRVRIRPGSPFAFGTIAREDASPLPVFGLAGNPVSAVLTFLVLVRPALLRMAGERDVLPPLIDVRAAEPLGSRSGLVHLLRVRLAPDGEGGWLARGAGAQGSGVMSTLAAADAVVVVPLDADGIAAGEVARAIPLRRRETWAAPRPGDVFAAGHGAPE